MKAKVTDKGVLVPHNLLKGVVEVEIRKENGIILVVPKTKEDTIFNLGKNPVACGAPDAAENPDSYLYAVNQ